MTESDKKSIYWTAGTLAALAAVIVVLWLAGVFQAPAM